MDAWTIAKGILLALGIIIGGVLLIVFLVRLYHNIGDWFSDIGQSIHETIEKDEFVGAIALILITVVILTAVNFIFYK